MTREQAHRIVTEWGRHLESLHPKLEAIFSFSIPNFFLPYPDEVLTDAINTVVKFYIDMGDRERSEIVRNSFGYLVFYVEPTEAIDSLSEYLASLKGKQLMLDKVDEYRKRARLDG